MSFRIKSKDRKNYFDQPYLSMALTGVFMVSTTPTRVSPEYQLVNCGEDGGRVKFSPVKPEQGMKLKSDSLKPACLVRKSLSLPLMVSNLAWSQSTVSSLLTATQSWLTPRLRTKSACSRVWPPESKPASNSPVVALTTRTATSALTKRCSVCQKQSMVTWRRLLLEWSRTDVYDDHLIS